MLKFTLLSALGATLLASLFGCSSLGAGGGSTPGASAGNATSGGSAGASGNTGGTNAGAAGGSGGSLTTSAGDAGSAGSAGSAGATVEPGAPGSTENTAPDDAPIGGPPDFGPNVQIFDPSMMDIQSKLDATANMEDEFSNNRFAYFFKPGQYNLDVRVRYYMQAIGLGASPDDVTITGAVRSKAELDQGNATTTFWKAVENLAVVPTQDNNVEVWGVSQGTSFRRVHVKGDINLWDNGWSSGGFIADTKIDGTINSGTQQQFFTRNTDLGKWQGGSYNMVFVGDAAAPVSNWPSNSYSVVAQTPVIREKPYLYIDANGNYFVRVPSTQQSTQSYTWATGSKPSGRAITTGNFYIAKAGDTAATLNAALTAGKHLLFTPGIYHLEASLDIENKDTVVIGLGLATLIPDNGTPAITIADVDGVKIAGFIVQAGLKNSDNLIVVGPGPSTVSHVGNPIALYDISCRVGGAAAGKATACVTVNSNDVLGDNWWLWRADHTYGVGWDQNVSLHGLVVNGNNMTMYALFCEHFEDYQTLWNGNGGRLYFYQSEMPYDPPNQAAWQHDGENGYPSYKVADTVTTHQALGLGVYAVFQTPVTADNAIEAPTSAGVQMSHMVTTCFGGVDGSQITHIFNGQGGSVSPGHTPSFLPQ
ncbi:MAG TPA: coagulation factor 5/8 type domain-containing protein [Polyangiaceae bacterium]|nr:coagulation factor 5/8 type domain-containing protein [Polyangiaceae bacterium]